MKNHYKNNVVWKMEFKNFLKFIFTIYNIDYISFCIKYSCSDSTVRYWLSGRNLPQKNTFRDLCSFLLDVIEENNYHRNCAFKKAEEIFARNNIINIFYFVKNTYSEEKYFIIEILSVLFNFSKNNFTLLNEPNNGIAPTGKTQAIVFDFDGTLTCGKTNQTTWESLWTCLGYDVRLCKELHMRYDRKEITHPQWCKLTEDKFCQRKLHKKSLEEIADNIKLINGIEDAFKQLASRNIKIYIVSGSILYIIKHALGNLYKYIDETKANVFKFDDNDYLTEIVGTKYDFEGKADFISNIASELKISPADIWFVGNSVNDRFAYKSGAKTLCINPKLTDPTNQTVWNRCIPKCENLLEIFQYI